MPYLQQSTSQLVAELNFLTGLAEMARTKSKLSDALRFYKTLKDDYELFEEVRKKIGQMLEDLSRETIPARMAEEDVRTVTLDDIGYRFTVSQRLSCSMPDKDAGISWLKSHGHGAIVIETVNAQTLASFAKTQVEETGVDLPPDIFKMSSMQFTSVTKAGR